MIVAHNVAIHRVYHQNSLISTVRPLQPEVSYVCGSGPGGSSVDIEASSRNVRRRRAAPRKDAVEGRWDAPILTDHMHGLICEHAYSVACQWLYPHNLATAQ